MMRFRSARSMAGNSLNLSLAGTPSTINYCFWKGCTNGGAMSGCSGSGDARSLLLRCASEPVANNRLRSTKNNSEKTNKENKSCAGSKKQGGAARGKNKEQTRPLDAEKLERLFASVENAVFKPDATVVPSSEPPLPPINDTPPVDSLASFLRLSLSSPRDVGSPMSCDGGDNTGGGNCRSPGVPLPQHPSPAQYRSPLGPGAVTSVPATQALLSTQDLTPGEAELRYRERCRSDSDALLASCPPHLAHVSQSYLKQAEAFNLADQCNAGLAPLPEPVIQLAAVQTQTIPQRTGASGMVGQSGKEAVLPHSEAQQQQQQHAFGGGGGGSYHPALLAAQERRRLAASSEAQGQLPPLQSGSGASPAAYHPALVAAEQRRKHQLVAQQAARPECAASAESLEQMQREYQAALARLNQAEPPNMSGAPLQPLNTNSVACCGSGGSQEGEKGGPSSSAAAAEPPGAGSTSVPSSPQTPIIAAATGVPLRQEAIRVFCVERANDRTGAFYRTFVATSYASAWRHYVTSHPQHLHWYEVLREGRPCHLYFDLEFGRGPGWNEGVDGTAMVDALLRHVAVLLARNWGVVLDPYSHVFELDSSTDQKFSRHLVVRLPGRAFFTNAAVGHFVAQVAAAAGGELEVAKAAPPSAERTCFVDTAVYTRNRHFRMAYSCKGGKAAVLRPTGRFATAAVTTAGGGLLKPSPASVFQRTLIGDVEPGATLLAVLPPLSAEELAERRGAGMGIGGGGVGGRNHSNGGVMWQGEVYHAGAGAAKRVSWKLDGMDRGPREDQAQVEALRAVAEAAVPFVEQAASQRARAEARARTVAFCGTEGTVAYSMIGPGSHYCERVGRYHKSNFVYYVANFATGMYAQKCHDPECAHFRSSWMPLPPELLLPPRQPMNQ